MSDDFSAGIPCNSTATRSASESRFSNWQGNSSPAFLSAVTPSLLGTAAALDVNRISFAGLNLDGSECSVIDFSTWLGYRSGISLLQGRTAVLECHTIAQYQEAIWVFWGVFSPLVKVEMTEFG